MQSTISQSLQSCLEPTLKMFVTQIPIFPSSFSIIDEDPNPTKPENNETITTIDVTKPDNDDFEMKIERKNDVGCWNFLEEMGNKFSNNENREETEYGNKVYVHPLAKSSTSTLSEKSLEMCTESLGSETGSDVCENGDDMGLLEGTRNHHHSLNKQVTTRKKMGPIRKADFPPPITSISGGANGGFKVRSHREGDRLVLQAVTIPSLTCFHAERSDGRLRLSFLRDEVGNDNDDDVDEDENDVDVDVEEDENVELKNGELKQEEDVRNEEEEEKCLAYCEEEEGDEEEEDIEGNNGVVEGEMEMRSLGRRISRCKEGGHGHKGLLNWKPFLGGYLKAS